MVSVVEQQQTARAEARATPAGRPVASVAFIVVFVLAGALALVLGLVQAFAWDLLSYVLVACVFGAVAALVLNDVVARRLAAVPHVPVGIAGAALSAVGGLVLWAAIVREWVIVAAADSLLLTVGMIGLIVSLRSTTPSSRPWHRLLPGVIGMAAAAVLMGAVAWSLASWVALVVWMVALTSLKVQLGPYLDQHLDRTRLTAWASAVVGVAGAAVLALGTWRSSQFAVMVGVTLAVGGLSALGIAGSRLRLSDGPGIALLAVGGAGVVAGFVWTASVVGIRHIALALVLLIVIVGAWFVFRGEGFIAVVLITGLVAWALIDRNDAPPPPAAKADAPRVVGVGDSFISGEGAEDFIEGTNVLGDGRNECRRSAKAYTFLVARQLDAGATLLACSGAETKEVLAVGQMPDSPASVPGSRPQIDELRDLGLGAGDVVLLSIGGNDVGFSNIVKACLLPAPCDDRARIWLRHVDDLRPILVDTYTQVRDAANGAVVIVVPYPNFVPDESCGIGLSDNELAFVREFLSRLDTTIADAAAVAGVEVFDGSATVFDGHRLCQPQPAANHLQLRPTDGPNLTRFAPAKWAHGPMHPNERGHRLLAAALQPMVAAALEPGAANPAPVVDGGSGAQPTDAALDDAADSVDDIGDQAWITSRLYAAALRLIIPLSVVLVAAVVAAIGFVQRRNPVARFLAP